MIKNIILFTLVVLFIFSCESKKSNSNISTTEKGLSAEAIYLSDGNDSINGSTFTYGETFFIHFKDMKGFNQKEEKIFPGMQVVVLDKKGDTIMMEPDIYRSNFYGVDNDPAALEGNLTVANPMHSNHAYTAVFNIYDKRDEGRFQARLDFEIIPDENIKVENEGITYDEIYLFSGRTREIITDAKINTGEQYYLVFEGLDGFTVEDDKVYIGMSIKATDASGNVIINEEDLIGDGGTKYTDVKTRLAPIIQFTENDINDPVKVKVSIWDKESDKKIEASISLEVK